MFTANWREGEASDAGEDGEPTGLLGAPGEPFSSAVLVVAVMGRWGMRMATGAVRSCGNSLGGEIFPWTNTECSVLAVFPFSCAVCVGMGSISIGSSRSMLFVLLDTANVARLEKRVMEGLLLDAGLVTMEETLEPAGGLLEVGDEEKAAGGDGGLDWLLRLL